MGFMLVLVLRRKSLNTPARNQRASIHFVHSHFTEKLTPPCNVFLEVIPCCYEIGNVNTAITKDQHESLPCILHLQANSINSK